MGNSYSPPQNHQHLQDQGNGVTTMDIKAVPRSQVKLSVKIAFAYMHHRLYTIMGNFCFFAPIFD